MGMAENALRCLLEKGPGNWGLPHVVVEIPKHDPKTHSVSRDEALPRPAAARQIARWLLALSIAKQREAAAGDAPPARVEA
jgi:hypothetical protein